MSQCYCEDCQGINYCHSSKIQEIEADNARLVKERDFASQQWRDWNAEADALAEKLESLDQFPSREIDRLQGNLDALKTENARLREALERIVSKRDKTLLGDCCVHKTCTAHFEDGNAVGDCAYRVGVNHGYAYQAAEAEEALAALNGK